MQRSYNDESIRLHAELNKRLEKLEDLVGNLSSSISEEMEVLEGQSGLRLVP
jgi:predicted DNA-binding protein